MSIFKSLKIHISEFHRQRLELIDNFDYSNVLWKVKADLGAIATEEYLKEGIENLKKYYAVALLDPLNEHAVSEKVDPFWHSHILFTKEYMDFCNSIFNQYIHHEPLNPLNRSEVRQVTSLYDYTLDIYNELFYDMSDDWWPPADSGLFNAICRHRSLYDNDIILNGIFKIESRLYNLAA